VQESISRCKLLKREQRKRYKLAHPDQVIASKRRAYKREKNEREYLKRITLKESIEYFKRKHNGTAQITTNIGESGQEIWELRRAYRPTKYNQIRNAQKREDCDKLLDRNGTLRFDSLLRWCLRD